MENVRSLHFSNGDCIRSMSDDKLAEFIFDNCDNPMFVVNDKFCSTCDLCITADDADCDDEGCKNAILKWLSLPVEDPVHVEDQT